MPGDDGREPAQIYGSNQVELAWTVIPMLIVVVLFLATARVIHAVEDARFPPDTTEITAVGHQFWWEFQYPQQGFVTANELHVPVSDAETSDADAHHAAVGRHRPQLLGPATGRQDRPDSQPHATRCGSSRTRPGSTSGSARSIAERSTPRCCCGWSCSRPKTSTAGSQAATKAGTEFGQRGQGPPGFRDHGLRELPHHCGHERAMGSLVPT